MKNDEEKLLSFENTDKDRQRDLFQRTMMQKNIGYGIGKTEEMF